MTKAELVKILPTIPDLPGCYLYFNKKGEVIYVGKAKNLRRRVSSYFNKEIVDPKTRKLVDSIVDLKYFVVKSESDALVLENNLIKQYSPRYNILLKDGSSYPFISVTMEEFPRMFFSRDPDRKKQRVYGPFTDLMLAKRMLSFLRQFYQLRTCRLALTQKKINQGAFTSCIQYQIKKCAAPCIGLIDRESYNSQIFKAEEVLKGNISSILKSEEEEMQKASENMFYEEAAECKRKRDLLLSFQAKNSVTISDAGNLSVFAYTETDTFAFVCMLHVKKGSVIRFITDAWKKGVEFETEEVFSSIIVDLLTKYPFNADQILLNIPVNWEMSFFFQGRIIVPKRGEKKDLVDLALSNAERFKKDKSVREEKLNPQQRAMSLMKIMMRDLSLKKAPRHIECFDNSNIQGTNPVAACVVFRDGKPSRKEYRKFHVKTVIGSDDYRSMYEIVMRRYKRILEESRDFPDLIVIDGGRGQLKMASLALSELNLEGEIPIIALAERLEEIFIPGKKDSLYLKRNSETLNVLRHIRDEAHRFGITFHRSLRSKRQISSELDEIPGVGEKTKENLLKTFGSVQQVKNASRQQLQTLIGKTKGAQIYDYLHAKKVIKAIIDPAKTTTSL